MGCSCYGSSLEYRVRGPGTPDPRDPGSGVPMIGPMNPRITIGFRGSPDPGSGAPRPRIRGPGPWPQNGTPFWTHFWLILGASPEAPLSRFWPGSPVLTVDSAQELFRTCSGRALKMTPYFGPFLRSILRPPGPKWAPKWASFLCVQPGYLKCTSPVGALQGPPRAPPRGPPGGVLGPNPRPASFKLAKRPSE